MWKALLAAWLIALAPAAMAQPPAPPAAPAAEASGHEGRLAAARRLMEASDAMAMAGQMMAAVEQQLVTVLNQLNPGKPAEVQSLVSDVLMPEFRARLGELELPTLHIWANAFTVAEMEELSGFYATPIGRKALAVMPQIFEQSQAIGMAWGQRVAQDAITKNQQAIRQRGLRI